MAALESFSLDSPLKKESPKNVVKGEQVCSSLGELRTKFVGEVDLHESTSHCDSYRYILTSVLDEEPLLRESKRRFVLFPIQYHEVCTDAVSIQVPTELL